MCSATISDLSYFRSAEEVLENSHQILEEFPGALAAMTELLAQCAGAWSATPDESSLVSWFNDEFEFDETAGRYEAFRSQIVNIQQVDARSYFDVIREYVDLAAKINVAVVYQQQLRVMNAMENLEADDEVVKEYQDMQEIQGQLFALMHENGLYVSSHNPDVLIDRKGLRLSISGLVSLGHAVWPEDFSDGEIETESHGEYVLSILDNELAPIFKAYDFYGHAHRHSGALAWAMETGERAN